MTKPIPSREWGRWRDEPIRTQGNQNMKARYRDNDIRRSLEEGKPRLIDAGSARVVEKDNENVEDRNTND